VLIEHCAGNFPLWLSPDQIALLPLSEKYQDYAESVYNQLGESDIRGFLDSRDEKIGRKIRDAEVLKVPFMLVAGEKEQAEGTVSVRRHGEGDLGSMKVADFIAFFKEQVALQMAGQKV
jgi:threonyl-tRNA synthetase